MSKQKFFLTLSLAFNVLFAAFFVFALAGKTASFSYYSMDKDGIPSVTAAVFASVPAESGAVVLNATEIELKKGDRAFLQFSAAAGGRQANWIMEAIYDREIISVKKNGFGIIIEALEPGETVMQTLAHDGFRDVAVIKIAE